MIQYLVISSQTIPSLQKRFSHYVIHNLYAYIIVSTTRYRVKRNVLLGIPLDTLARLYGALSVVLKGCDFKLVFKL